MREVLARAIGEVVSGSMDIERASALHKLAKNVTESLYSETKIAMFAHEAGKQEFSMGNLPLGQVSDK